MASGNRNDIIAAFLMNMKDRCASPEHLQYLQDFITTGYASGFITDKNLPQVVKKLMKIEKFENLPANQRGIFGATFHANNSPGLTVQVNPDLRSMGPHLTEMYAFHELVHVLLDGDADLVREDAMRNAHATPAQADQVADGYTSIEEAVAQNAAEQMISHLYPRDRANEYRMGREPSLPGLPVRTNFHYYGLYQPIAKSFARTLRGIGNLPSRGDDDTHLNALSARAFNGGFAAGIIDEYKRDGQYNGLESTLYRLGLVFRAKLAEIYGQRGAYGDDKVVMAYQTAIQSLDAMRDQRPPLRTHDQDER